ncbi:methyltransferase domain-containing protein [Ottowia sp. GY511]|uniref:Class I SAM-dependent methyltransferase n=1 Tax=Ottowia flava TaxID=2675430 RepID=A0ABW4KUX0_9BURK|nr:class I SAM-dependent methyltransferase [Ottowia sp. GY511]TXK24781.1 methyltransferase domain-containing protein [Ottowia sp. GY511]
MPLIAPTTEQTRDELALIARWVPLHNLRVIELGCGGAALSRRLVQTRPDCSVLALEVDAIQHAQNLAAPAVPGLRFVAAGAQAIPSPDAQFDLALMLKSLHHVPLPLLDQALAETRRVLRLRAHLYVSEPVFDGPLNEINRLFNDEQQVREAAYAAVQRALATGGWREVAELHFDMPVRFTDFDDYERRMTGVTYADRRWSPGMRDAVRERFEALKPPPGTPFLRPMRINLLQTL